MNRSGFLIGVLFAAWVLQGCRVYHDTTAHFNAYFLAKEKMEEAEWQLFGNPPNRFHEVLDVLIPIDTNYTKSQSAAFDYVIEKSSLPIQFHEISKWVDDCYLLIGKARIYKGDFGNAATTFKYVNAHSDDDNARHTALIWLMRLFLEVREYNNFLYIKELINSEDVPFSEANTRDYHLVMAQYTMQQDEYEVAAQHLALAAPLVEKRAEKARLHFTLGQLFERSNERQKAFEAYQTARKLSPTYELAFYATAGEKASSPVASDADEDELGRFYKRQIADEKNWDYRDKLYYDWAELKVRCEKYPEAIVLLNESIQASTNNTAQKSLSYLRSGELYYEIRKFQEAATYYDSAMQIMPKDLKRYPEAAKRSEILQDFIKQYNIVQHSDKLLALSKLPPDEVVAFFEKEIAYEKEKIIQFQENKKLNEQRNQRVVVTSSTAPGASNTRNTTWYFYNPDLVVLGRSNFLRQWGDRPLQDNWRLASKQAAGRQGASQTDEQANAKADEERDELEAAFADVKTLEQRLDEMPDTPEKMTALHETLEAALFRLGNIYYYDLLEKRNALETLDRFVNDYPDHVSAPEAAYMLYLLCKTYVRCQDSTYRDLLVAKFPKSFYAKVMLDADYPAKMKAIDAEVEKIYAQAFEYHRQGFFAQSEQLVRQIEQNYEEHSHQDKVALLSAMLKARTENTRAYFQALNEFITQFPDSELVAYAKQLLGH